ncbi:MAG: hypothetical protein K5683_04745 [Prevotella sp.]|nr:hypothetical protein [Prevotella sp.]
MRKIHLIIITVMSLCLMASCDNKKSNKNWAQEEDYEDTEMVDEETADDMEVAPEALWTEDAVADMLRKAYKDASLIYAPSEDGQEANIDLDAMYCSKYWNEVLQQVRAIDARQSDPSKRFGDGNAQWNYWMEGAVEPKDIKVTLLTGNMAEATFDLTHGEEWMHTRVSLDFEDGEWRISDWLEVGDSSQSLLEAMEKFVEKMK